MAKILGTIIIAWLAGFAQTVCAAANPAYAFTNAFPGLVFTNPVCIASPPNESNRLFIVEKRGRIVVITNLAAPTRAIFMDLSAEVLTGSTDIGSGVSDERGLLGLAFHPGYASNGFFYVFYTCQTNTSATGLHDVLARFRVSPSNPNQGNLASEIRYIVQYDQAVNHNAGDLHFGSDGYLYVSLGDEGGSYGQYTNTQRIDKDFFSAIMRLDVDKKSGSLPPNFHASALPSLTNYAIPTDNPYVGAPSFNGSPVNPLDVRTEFWAVGMRNPWRFSFDPVTDILYLGHVGQGTVEWVNIVTNGANCGWNFFEGGKQWTNNLLLPPGFVLNPPLVQYGHTNSRNCIIGGIVYRGSRIPQLSGAYLYADAGSGEVWTLRHSGITVTQNQVILTNTGVTITAFGADPSNGDVLFAEARSGNNSRIERLIDTTPKPVPRITEITVAGTDVVLKGTNGSPSKTYYVQTSTNLAPPAPNWTAVATSLFDASGNFTLTNSIAPGFPQRFFRLQVP